MGRNADPHRRASPPESGKGVRRGRQPSTGLGVIDLLLVLVILAFLAAVIIPRYDSPADFSKQARLQAARSALSEGYSRLKLATACYAVDHGDLPENFTDLIPNYMNATECLGDYTAVYVQGAGQITVEIYPGANTAGTPLSAETFPWP